MRRKRCGMCSIILPPDMLDLAVKWDAALSTQATFHTGLDNASCTVRVAGGGIWSGDDAQRYFDSQRRIIDVARRRFGPLKVFYDVREWVVEHPDSALQFQRMNREIYRPEDRLVAVVKSSIDKVHPRTALAVGTRESFISVHAAETWLQAYSSIGAAAA